MSSRWSKSKKILSPHSHSQRTTVLGICVFLVAITWLVFGETLRHPSINFDDPQYVFENPQINTGLTLTGILWASDMRMLETGIHLLRSRTCWIVSCLDCGQGGITSPMFYCTRPL